jgi:hypothetical protein
MDIPQEKLFPDVNQQEFSIERPNWPEFGKIEFK